MMRLFLAFHIKESIRRELASAQERLRESGADVRWSSAENFHLTVKFLGDMEEGRLPDVEEACAWVASECEPFRISLRGVSTFPKRGPEIKTLWAAVEDGAETWRRTATKADEAFTAFGVAREGGLVPHVTLGRVRSARERSALKSAIAAEAQRDFGTQEVGNLLLIRSVLDPDGAVYEELRRWTLSVPAQ